MDDNLQSGSQPADQPTPPPTSPPPSSSAPPPPPQYPGYPPQKKRSLWWLWTLLIIGVLFIISLPILFFTAIVAAVIADKDTLSPINEGVAVIRIEGVITAGKQQAGLFEEGGAGSENIVAQIDRALDDNKAKAILLRINSPGGSAAGAQEIYSKLKEAQGKKPIYVSMGDMAASGGYYIASAADKIYCNPGTITGSIGVISTHADLSELFEKVGVKYETYTAGKYKDMGTFSRSLTEKEKQIMDEMLQDIYNQFLEDVADGRKMSKEEVLEAADGRIYTGRQALKANLVDELGGYQKALNAVGKKAGIKGEVQAIEYGPDSFFEFLFGDDYTQAMSSLSRRMIMNEITKELSAQSLTTF